MAVYFRNQAIVVVQEILYMNKKNGYTLIECREYENQRKILVRFYPRKDEPDMINIFLNHFMYGKVIEFHKPVSVGEATDEVFDADSYEMRDDLVDISYLIADILKQAALPGLKEELEINRFLKRVSGNLLQTLGDIDLFINAMDCFLDTEAKETLIAWHRVLGFLKRARRLMEYHVPAYACVYLSLYSLQHGSYPTKKILNNPYLLHDDLKCMTVAEIDKCIAKPMNIQKDDPRRIRSCVLELMTKDRDTSIRKSVLIKKACGKPYYLTEDQVTGAINALEKKDLLRIYYARSSDDTSDNDPNNPSYMVADMEDDEQYIAIRAFLAAIQDTAALNVDFDVLKTRMGGKGLDQDQQKAVIAAAAKTITLVTGGAGVGKTHTITAIYTMLRENGLTIAMAAPTGRAAKRMQEATGADATTIHKLLEYSKEGFRYNEENKLRFDAIIIDESSMISTSLMRMLLFAVSENTRLIFVGDPNQLQPVEAGAPFKTMVNSGYFGEVRLTQNHRQGEGSQILTLANRVLAGKPLDFSGCSEECELYAASGAENVQRKLIEVVERLMKDQTDPDDIVVLAPTNYGEIGVETLNDTLREYLNPTAAEDFDNTIRSKDGMYFSKNDRVMQTINNNHDHVYNGDVGRVTQILNTYQLRVQFGEKPYGYSLPQLGFEDGELTLAYALTVHKSQGSEYPVVIFLADDSQKVYLYRELLYTAITRAQKKIIMIGGKDLINDGIRRTDQTKTQIGDHLSHLFDAWEDINDHASRDAFFSGMDAQLKKQLALSFIYYSPFGDIRGKETYDLSDLYDRQNQLYAELRKNKKQIYTRLRENGKEG